MWQRKQTIYLLLIAICLLALQGLPVMHINDPVAVAAMPEAQGLQGMPREVYCAWIYNPNNQTSEFGWWSVLAVLSVVAAVLAIITIFGYSNLKKQMKYCRAGQMLMVLWLAVAAVLIYVSRSAAGVTVQFGLCLPVISIILYQLAYKGVKNDYDLIRSADRIR